MASALGHLAELLERRSEDPVLVRRIAHRQASLERFGPLFSSEGLPELTAEQVGEFLARFPGLRRNEAPLTADMRQLRAVLAQLLDETTPIQTRLDWLWPANGKPIPGLGKAVATTILFVGHPGAYGIWNSTCESAMRQVGLWPQFPRGWTLGRQYLLVNRVLTTAAAQLGVDVGTLDALWPTVGRPPAAVPAAPSVAPARRAAPTQRPAPARTSAAGTGASQTSGASKTSGAVQTSGAPRTGSSGAGRAHPAARVRPVAEAAGFTCRSCYLVKPYSQAAAAPGLCLECAEG